MLNPNEQNGLAEVRAPLAYFDRLKGPETDCGESCKMVSINLLRVLVKAFDQATREAA